MDLRAEVLAAAEAYFRRAQQGSDDFDRFRDCWAALNAIYDCGRWSDRTELRRAQHCVADLVDATGFTTMVLALPETRWLAERPVVWEPTWGTIPAGLRRDRGLLVRAPDRRAAGTRVVGIHVPSLDAALNGGGDTRAVANQLIAVIYAIRNNLVHGNKEIERADNIELVRRAAIPLSQIVSLVVVGIAQGR